MEPRASRPARRLAAIKVLAAAGVPVGYLQAPMIPGLTDAEAPGIGEPRPWPVRPSPVTSALRLPFAVKSLFEQWLEHHYPELKNRSFIE